MKLITRIMAAICIMGLFFPKKYPSFGVASAQDYHEGLIQEIKGLNKFMPNKRMPDQSNPHAINTNLPDRVAVRKFNTSGYAPLNVEEDSSSDIWFSTVSGDSIGKLDLSASQVRIFFNTQSQGYLWYISKDSNDRIWYVTTFSTGDVLGYFEETGGTGGQFVEWSSNDFEYLFGIEVDASNGDIWFLSRGEQPKIFKFSPSSQELTGWAASGYEWLYDLSISPDGHIWVTDFPWQTANATVLELDPSTNVLTEWPLPTLNQAPFLLNGKGANEIWVSEYVTQTNSLAKLNLVDNTYNQYSLPISDSYPSGLEVHGQDVWFYGSGIYSIGLLTLPTTPDAQTTLTKTQNTVNPTQTTLSSNTYPVSPSSFPLSSPATTIIFADQYDPFSLFPIPNPGSCNPTDDDAIPFGLTRSSSGGYWFGGCSYVGHLQAFEDSIFFPLILKP